MRVDDWTVSVGLRLDQRGPVVLREPVTEADLIDPLSEVWLEGVLRKGRAHVELAALRSRLAPVFSKSGATCTGYTLEVEDPEGHTGKREFTIHSLDNVAARGAQRLVHRGEMREGDLFYFVMLADRGRGKPSPAPTGIPALIGETTTRPVETLETPLAPLLRTGRIVGPPPLGVFKVLYTESALTRAETLARKGADSDPPVETGGVLIGSLARCSETGDLFVLVLDVIEATGADEKRFSLYYSGETWARIQAVLRAMQSQPATRTWRIVGQTHGHNFLPDGGAPPCEACAHLPVCGRSSVFVSEQDINWSRAVFPRQPWHLSHIFGLNARQEKVHGLFGLRDGRLLERGFHVVPDFPLETRGE